MQAHDRLWALGGPAAGVALARLHLAAADFARPARPPAVLMNSCQVITAPDPLDAARALVAARPALAAYLAERRWQEDFAEILVPLIGRAAPELAALRPQWAHGDWHPSNLTWTSAAPDARVAGIFDFGLANRTFAVHDLALALERAVVSWLDLPETGTASADLSAAAVLLDGYQTVRPLTGAEAVALPLVLPVVHVEYALSEADYFTSVAISAANADLAYEYLIGHARWFGQPEGAALLRFFFRHQTALDRVGVGFVDVRQSAIYCRGVDVAQDNRHAARAEPLRDSGTHDARANDRGVLNFLRRGFRRTFPVFVRQKEIPNQVLRRLGRAEFADRIHFHRKRFVDRRFAGALDDFVGAPGSGVGTRLWRAELL